MSMRSSELSVSDDLMGRGFLETNFQTLTRELGRYYGSRGSFPVSSMIVSGTYYSLKLHGATLHGQERLGVHVPRAWEVRHSSRGRGPVTLISGQL